SPVQRKGADAALGEVTPLLGGRGPDSAATALAAAPTSGGQPVQQDIAAGVERATGQPLGDVRVHTDEASAAAAHAVSARAFTTGNNIYLSAQESPGDRELMSHELAHTLQQTQGAKVEAGVSQPGQPLEQEADQIAHAAVSGGTATVTTGVGGSLMRDAVSDVEALLSGDEDDEDWILSDVEAAEALAILAALPSAELTSAMARLGQTYKTRLLDNLPESAKQTSGYTKVLVAMGPDAIQPYIKALLTYGTFDWTNKAEAAKVFQILRVLTTPQQTTLAIKLGAKLRSHLSENLADVREQEYPLLRLLFDNTPDAEIMTLCHWVGLRFTLIVDASTDRNGVPWDKRGLRHCWDVLETLPAAHVEHNDNLTSLTRYRATNIVGQAGSGSAELGYGDSKDLDKDLEVGKYTDKDDPMRGKNLFDATVRHEVGHQVEKNVGGDSYVKTESGGAWLQWNKPDSMAIRMVVASGGKISTWPNEAQKLAIIQCLQSVIDDQKPLQLSARLGKLPFLADHATNPEQDAQLTSIKDDDAVKSLLVAFDSPWKKDAGGVPLGGRIYHESYEKNWVSYKQSARDRKVSTYQFRAPSEWFAEAYAAYYQPPGAKGELLAKVDPTTKAWFDGAVDPQQGAGGTTGAAGSAGSSGSSSTGPGKGGSSGTGP
ncbi:MAG TPA: DUF4157 domain-containing protein, partial [Kofleriaceae bacterium]|nr:DUF4157 domain-containing protein [Kofleriaceae bacterium]